MVTTVAVPQQPHIPFMHLEGSGENMLRDCKKLKECEVNNPCHGN